MKILFLSVLLAVAFSTACSDRTTTESITAVPESDPDQFQETASLHPDDDGVQTRLATLFFEAGRLDEAQLTISSALSINPENQEALVLAGVIAGEMGQQNQVVEYLERVAELNRDNPMRGINMRLQAVYYELGVAYSALGQPDEAITRFHEALAISPTDADSYFQLGLALEKTGNADGAIDSLRGSTRLVPDFVEAYEALARIYVSKGDQPRADWAGAMIDIANGDHELAIERLRSVLRYLPESVDVYLGLGLAFEKIERPALAAAAYGNVMRLDSDNWLAQQRLNIIETSLP